MSDIRVIIVGKIDRADWQHNFALVDQALDDLAGKLPINQKASAGGLASLNDDLEVIQTALNSERLNGKTEAEISQLFVLIGSKGAANGVAELDGAGKLKASQVPEGLVSGLTYKGSWDASANNPTIPAASGGNDGWFYIVSVAGSTIIDGEGVWEVGDWIISNGASWQRVPATATVLSVAGKTGVVLLQIADIVDLESELDTKMTIGAEAATIEPTDFNDVNTPGEYFIADLS